MIMVKYKEYPATHSMETSWFGIDKDGNVGIIRFEDDGPVPIFMLGSENGGEHDVFMDEIMNDILPTKRSGFIYDLPLSDEQAESVLKQLGEPIPDSEYYTLELVRIDPAKTEMFFEGYKSLYHNGDNLKLVCLSSSHGLYYGWFPYHKGELIQKMVDDRIILANKLLYWHDLSEFDETEFEIPMYLFSQRYERLEDYTIVGDDMERIMSPMHPVSESQISDSAKTKALMFPFSFKDVESFKIRDFYKSKMWGRDYENDND